MKEVVYRMKVGALELLDPARHGGHRGIKVVAGSGGGDALVAILPLDDDAPRLGDEVEVVLREVS